MATVGQVPVGCDGRSTAPHYTALADDSKQEPKKREAAALISIADGHLNKEEDFVQGRLAARQAIQLFKELGDNRGIADATRVLVNSFRIEVQMLSDIKDRHGAHAREKEQEHAATLEEARQVAQEALAHFKAINDRLGEAYMLLSVCDVKSEMHNLACVQEAKEHCKDAIAIFRDVAEIKMEACAVVTLVNVYVRLGEPQEAYDAARLSLEVCRAVPEEKKVHGDALHAMALAMSMLGMDGLPTAMQALDIYREVGPQKLEAFELHTIGKMFFDRGSHREAIPYAKAATQMFEEISYGKGWQLQSRELLMKAYIHKGDSTKALKVANDGLQRAKEAKPQDLKNLVLAYQNIATANLTLAQGFSLEDAIQAADESIRICKQMGNQRWEAHCHHNIAQAQLRLGRIDACLEAAQKSVDIYAELDQKEDEATSLHTIAFAYAEKELFDKSIKVFDDIRGIYQPTSYRNEAGAMLSQARIILKKAQANATTSRRTRLLREAIYHAEGAKDAFVSIGDSRQEAEAWDFITLARQEAGDLKDAVNAAQSSALAYKNAGHWGLQANSLHRVATTMLKMERVSEAVAVATEALQMARATGNSQKETEMLMLVSQAQLAKLCANAKKSLPANTAGIIAAGQDAAIRPAREAVAISRKLHSDLHLAMSLQRLAEALLTSGSYPAALKAGEEAVEVCARAGQQSLHAMSLLAVAEAHFGLQHVQECQDAAQDALDICRGLGDEEGESKALEVIASFVTSKETTVPTTSGTTAHRGAELTASRVEAKKQTMDPDIVQRIVAEQIRSSLSDGDEEDIHLDQPLMDLGMDSLAAVSFRETLGSAIGFKLPASLIFDYPSAKAVIDFCIEESTSYSS